MNEPTPQQTPNLQGLAGYMVKSFSMDELSTLCHSLGVDPDEVKGQTKSVRVWELINYMERRERIAELVQEVERLRSRPKRTHPKPEEPAAEKKHAPDSKNADQREKAQLEQRSPHRPSFSHKTDIQYLNSKLSHLVVRLNQKIEHNNVRDSETLELVHQIAQYAFQIHEELQRQPTGRAFRNVIDSLRRLIAVCHSALDHYESGDKAQYYDDLLGKLRPYMHLYEIHKEDLTLLSAK